MVSELSSILITAISTSGGLGAIGGWIYWKQNKKLKNLEVALKDSEVDKARIESKSDEWHLYKEQLDAANTRIKELLEINREKERRTDELDANYDRRISAVEERFLNQTNYLRGIQRQYKEALEENNRLTIKIGKMQRVIDHLLQWICRRPWKDCKRREPEQIVKPLRYIPLEELNEYACSIINDMSAIQTESDIITDNNTTGSCET